MFVLFENFNEPAITYFRRDKSLKSVQTAKKQSRNEEKTKNVASPTQSFLRSYIFQWLETLLLDSLIDSAFPSNLDGAEDKKM